MSKKQSAAHKKAKQALSDANKAAWKKQQAFKIPMDREGQLREAERLQEQERNKGKPAAAPVTDPEAVKRAEEKQVLREANRQAWKNLQGSSRDPESWRREVERLLKAWNGKPPVKKKSPKPKSPPQPKPMSEEEKASFWERMNALWAVYEERLGRHKAIRRGENREAAEKRWFEKLIKPLTEAEAMCMRQLAARHEARKKLQEFRLREIAEADAKRAFALLKEQRLPVIEAIEAQETVKRRRKSTRQRERELERERERTRAAEIPKETKDAYLWLVDQPERQDQRILDHYGGIRELVTHLVEVSRSLDYLRARGLNSKAEEKNLKLGIRQLRREHRKAFGIKLVWKDTPSGPWDAAVLEHYSKATSRVFAVQALEIAGLDATALRELVVRKIREEHLLDLAIPLVWELSDDCIDDPVALLDELFGSDD